jgi:hypothetical protein
VISKVLGEMWKIYGLHMDSASLVTLAGAKVCKAASQPRIKISICNSQPSLFISLAVTQIQLPSLQVLVILQENPPQLHLTNLQIQFLWPFMTNFTGSPCVDQSSSIGIELSAKLWYISNVIAKKESKSFREKIVFHQRSSVKPDAQHRDSWEGERLPPVSD